MVADSNPAPVRSATASRTVTIRIRRQDNPGDAPRWEEFRIDVEPGANVIACLQQIARTPRTTDGRDTTPVCYDSGCLEEVCGSCAMIINGISGLCITKLDVLDGLREVLVCTGYRLDGRMVDILPLDADDITRCEPVYETFEGWSETSAGMTRWDDLPARARQYLLRVQELIGVPIDMVSTGPDREHTIVLRHPFQH